MTQLERLVVLDACNRRIIELSERKRLTKREARTLGFLSSAYKQLEIEYQEHGPLTAAFCSC